MLDSILNLLDKSDWQTIILAIGLFVVYKLFERKLNEQKREYESKISKMEDNHKSHLDREIRKLESNLRVNEDEKKQKLESLLNNQSLSFQNELDRQSKYLQSELIKQEERYKKYLDFNFAVDEDLRNKRLEVYKKLWTKMILLPQYPKNNELTYGNLQELCEDFKEWYFKEGGIFLTEDARKKYGDVQEKLENSFKEDKDKIVVDDYEAIRKSLSLLRTQFTNDIKTRRKLMIK